MKSSKSKTKPESTESKRYEKLGRVVESSLIKDYIEVLQSTPRQIWSSFVRGLFTGLGSVIGATLMVALVIYLLNVFGGLPVIGHFFQDIGHTISK